MKKFQLGDTYGKTTADILTNDDVSNLFEPKFCRHISPTNLTVFRLRNLVPWY